jgi:hypothetical protein
MPKRKSNPCSSATGTSPSVSCLDAALDILACDTFTSLQRVVRKFESAAGIQLNDGVAKQRWEEACKRYWVTKALEGLSCDMSRACEDKQDVRMETEAGGELPHDTNLACTDD